MNIFFSLYPRMDWNLLSTASPAIDAWLNPSDRLMTAVRKLVREYSRRLCCVIACLMIEGLESQGIHVAYKVWSLFKQSSTYYIITSWV